MLDTFYPVGTVYTTLDNNFNPNNSFGGTWEKIKDTFLLSSGDTYTSGNTGGESEHILTVAEMPTHVHNNAEHHGGSHNIGFDFGEEQDRRGRVNFLIKPDEINVTNRAYVHGQFTTYTPEGDGIAHNNMPPYLVVNVWKRIA